MAINRDLGYKPFILCRVTATARYGQRFVPKLSGKRSRIFQNGGDYCFECWQEVTYIRIYLHLSHPELNDRIKFWLYRTQKCRGWASSPCSTIRDNLERHPLSFPWKACVAASLWKKSTMRVIRFFLCADVGLISFSAWQWHNRKWWRRSLQGFSPSSRNLSKAAS
jgi:hypothetical protein